MVFPFPSFFIKQSKNGLKSVSSARRPQAKAPNRRRSASGSFSFFRRKWPQKGCPKRCNSWQNARPDWTGGRAAWRWRNWVRKVRKRNPSTVRRNKTIQPPHQHHGRNIMPRNHLHHHGYPNTHVSHRTLASPVHRALLKGSVLGAAEQRRAIFHLKGRTDVATLPRRPLLRTVVAGDCFSPAP